MDNSQLNVSRFANREAVTLMRGYDGTSFRGKINRKVRRLFPPQKSHKKVVISRIDPKTNTIWFESPLPKDVKV